MVIRTLSLGLALLLTARAEEPVLSDRTPEPNAPYKVLQLEHPADLRLEVSGLAKLPGGKLAVAIRRGEIWIADNPYAADGKDLKWHRFASALHEPLGLVLHEGALYTTQRSEVTRIRDTDGDGVADEYLAYAKGWGVSGAYHEYAYGPKFDPAGHAWITLNCSMGNMAFPKQTDWRGYSLLITPDGQWKPVSGGMRSPSGIGINEAGDAFFTEQQGNWNCGGGVHHMRQGAFHGHQASFASSTLPGAPFAKPAEKVEAVRMADMAKRLPIYKPASVWLPYRKMGMSCTDLVLDTAGGKFGPYAGQFFIGEFTMSQINRIFLEKVEGEYQGACFPFLDGLQCGVLRMEFGEDGSLFVGETNRGWNSLGNRSYGLERVIFNGHTPFEIQKMEARPKGFRLTFTRPIQRDSLAKTKWEMESYTYEYHAAYGGLELDSKALELKPTLSADGRTVELEVSELRAGYIHELNITGLLGDDGQPLWHHQAYYTLNQLAP